MADFQEPPASIRALAGREPLRAWTTFCSTGEGNFAASISMALSSAEGRLRVPTVADQMTAPSLLLTFEPQRQAVGRSGARSPRP